MKKLLEKQNSDFILRLLFSQSKLYDRAELFNNLSWLIATITLVIGLIDGFMDIYNDIVILIEFILLASALILDRIKSDDIKKGAATKKYIDCNLFSMHYEGDYNESYLNELAINIMTKYPEEYAIKTTNTGEDIPRGLRNWYTPAEGGSINETIYQYQQENIWWNGKLVKAFAFLVLSLLIIISSAILILCWFFNPEGRNIIRILLLSSSFLINIGQSIYRGITYWNSYNKAQGKVNMMDCQKITKKSLVELQKEIDSMRGSGFLVPSYLHKIRGGELHKVWRRLRNI